MRILVQLRWCMAIAVLSAVLGFALGARFFERLAESSQPNRHVVSGGTVSLGERTSSVPASAPKSPGQSSALVDASTALELRGKGRYVLDSDIRERSQKMAIRAERTAQLAIADRRDEYLGLFSRLGMDNGTISELLYHIEKIFYARAVAQNYIAVLQNAQEAYDHRVENILGGKYNAYADFEARYVATVEANKINELASASTTQLSSEEISTIVDQIQKVGAVTFNGFSAPGGPFTEITPQFSGKAFVPTMTAHIDRLERQTDELIELARGNNLSEAAVQAIGSYYRKEIQSYRERVARASQAR